MKQVDMVACVHSCKWLNGKKKKRARTKCSCQCSPVCHCLYFLGCKNVIVHLVVLALCEHKDLQQGVEVVFASWVQLQCTSTEKRGAFYFGGLYAFGEQSNFMYFNYGSAHCNNLLTNVVCAPVFVDWQTWRSTGCTTTQMLCVLQCLTWRMAVWWWCHISNIHPGTDSADSHSLTVGGHQEDGLNRLALKCKTAHQGQMK